MQYLSQSAHNKYIFLIETPGPAEPIGGHQIVFGPFFAVVMKDSAIISGNINIVAAATPYSIEPVSDIAFLFSPGIPVVMENNTVISHGEDIIPIEPINTIKPYAMSIIDTIPCLPVIMEYDAVTFIVFRCQVFQSPLIFYGLLF